MYNHVASSKLPVELLSLVFDHLALAELLGCSRVSSFWRAVAFQHRVFWRDIKLTSLETPALELFHARLQASSNQDIKIYVCLPCVRFPDRLRSIVMPSVAGHLHRIDSLHFRIDIGYDADVFKALAVPALRLTIFDVTVVHDSSTVGRTWPSNALPADLFAGSALKLRKLRLQDVQLFAERLPPAFSGVDELVYTFREHQSFPTAVFVHCKSLRKLRIVGDHCTVVNLQDNERTLPAANLDSLSLATFSGSSRLVEQMPCASIPYTNVPLGDVRSARLLLGHLRGRLEVNVTSAPSCTVLQYRSSATNTTRAFSCSPNQADIGFLPSAYIASDILARIDHIRASSDTINILTAFAYLPSCTRATFTLTAGGTLKAPSMPLYAQELQTVCICSTDVSRTVTGVDLESFLDLTFLPIPHVVQVVLEGVTADCDIEAIPRDRFLVAYQTGTLTAVASSLSYPWVLKTRHHRSDNLVLSATEAFFVLLLLSVFSQYSCQSVATTHAFGSISLPPEQMAIRTHQ